ncbi:MAG TPA: FAD:protein FMN transferase [Candidatus Dormibacteraeota bacterium]
MRSVREVMGMPITVDVRDKDAGKRVLDEVFADFTLVDQTFSPFIPASETSRIDRGELQPEDASPLMQQVLNLCRLYETATDGYFSAWIAGRLDPSGLVKGLAIDRASSILDRYGYRHYFVEAAGDIRTRQPVGTGGPWRIGIRHPVERNKVARVILANDLAVATSGTYEKGAHVRDPHTGRQVSEWLSFTVIGSEILKADVYATAAMAMGKRGVEFIEALPYFEAYAIDPQLRATWTSGFSALSDSGEAASG